MFEFGRELKRILGAGALKGDLDPALFELCDLNMLAIQAGAFAIEAGRVSTREPFPLWIKASALWREHARRSGDAVSLRKAAAAAVAAEKVARDQAETACAVLEEALTSLTGADLYGDMSLLDAARELMKTAATGSGDALFEARLEAAFARQASREALAADNWDRAMEAAALFDSAIHKLDDLVAERGSAGARAEAGAARIERSDLLAGFGLRRRDPKLLERAGGDLADLLDDIDADYEPLTWLRAAEVVGSALVSLGEIEGRAEHITEGVSTLADAGERIEREHSPLDWARLRHAFAVGLQALGEACDSDPAFARAEAAFDEAAEALAGAPLTIRSTVANNRAACLARAAERRGDLEALARAEAAFKTELASTAPGPDPVSWAVVQVNLARVYESRAELMGAFKNRDAAVYALEEALEIFCEHGLKTLAEAASSALGRVATAG
jgi:hypothetical protein